MADTTRTRPSPRRHAEDGVTLVELLVTMVLMGILGALVATSAVTAHRAAGETSDRLEAVGDARIAVNAIARSLRTAVRPSATAPLLRTAHPRELSYLASVADQPVPDLVRVLVDDGELTEQRWTARAGTGPSWEFPGPPRERGLLADVPDDLVVFHYRDQDACGVGAGTCPELDATATTEGLAPTARNSVDLVELVVAARSAQAEPFELRTQVVLRNFGFVPEREEVNP